MEKKLIYLIIVLLFAIIVFDTILIVNKKGVDFDKFTPFCDEKKEYIGTLITSDIPRINAAVACYPFASKIVETTCEKESYTIELKHLSTREVYKTIINNLTDIAICSDTFPAQAEKLYSLEDAVVVPIARDGLVFYTNKKNTINSISVDNINKMYCGKINNWNELTNYDEDIKLFQLRKNVGGSEACFASLVDNDQVIRNQEFVAYDMKNIIDLTANNNGGIGYAFNQFYEKMYNLNSVKKLAIDGIEPTYENISQGKYPLMFNIYFIYRNNNTNENITKLLDWLSSEEGREMIIECGLQPVLWTRGRPLKVQLLQQLMEIWFQECPLKA